MNIKFEQDFTLKEIEILVRYGRMDQEAERITALLQSADTRIKCSLNGCEHLIKASDIYYAESVDKRSFVYCEKSVYQTELRLYQLAESLRSFGFVQVSKACILNINMLDFIKPLFNSRMEATLKNGERLYVTRKYLGDIKRALWEETK